MRIFKFTVSALAANDEAGGEDDDSCGGTRHRHVRLYLTGSAGMERQRDMLLQRVMPAISDLCHRRGGSLSVVDLRMTIEADHGLGTATIAHRLEALDGCNALVCLVDSAVEERRVLVSEDALAKMPSDKMLALLVKQLESGEAGMSAVQQWLKLTEVMGELLAAQQAIASQDELDQRLGQRSPPERRAPRLASSATSSPPSPPELRDHREGHPQSIERRLVGGDAGSPATSVRVAGEVPSCGEEGDEEADDLNDSCRSLKRSVAELSWCFSW